jgi:hypothetical protein
MHGIQPIVRTIPIIDDIANATRMFGHLKQQRRIATR